jgi:ParB family chromosome partitioning protein
LPRNSSAEIQDKQEKIMARKTGLGKGLDALLPGDNETGAVFDGSPAFAGRNGAASEIGGTADAGAAGAAAASGGIVQLSPDKLVPSPGQPRKNFDQSELEELAASIVEHGMIQPIIAARATEADGEDGSYIIIAGERRTRAARLAGIKQVPVIIRDYTDQKRMEISLIENIQRTDLNPIEEAAAYKNLMDFSGLSQDELAGRVGKNRSTIANALRLLKLPGEMQKSIEQGEISPGHARALLSVNDTKSRSTLFQEILSKGISVREAEKRASAMNAGTGTAGGGKNAERTTAPQKRAPEIGAMEEKFIGRLGTKVVIDGDMNKGRIHIDYYSMEDLERLYEILGG